MPDVSIVIPSNRPEQLRNFLHQWRDEFSNHDHEVIIVEDNPKGWAEIDKDLEEDSWIIPRNTDAIRSYGFLKARGEIIITLDDDCLPSTPDFVAEHVRKLTEPAEEPAWCPTVYGSRTRGLPFGSKTRQRRCVLSHGLWKGNPDLDAITQLAAGEPQIGLPDQIIPRHKFFPMCGMNLAFHRDLLPAMYFLLMGPEYEYDRFADIWCGLFVKKIIDHLGWAVHSGKPYVLHSRASDPWANLKKELDGYEVNETLWQTVDRMDLFNNSVAECYQLLASQLPGGAYWGRLREAMVIWTQKVYKKSSMAVA